MVFLGLWAPLKRNIKFHELKINISENLLFLGSELELPYLGIWAQNHVFGYNLTLHGAMLIVIS